MDAKCKRKISNSRVGAQVETDRHASEPAAREQDPNQDGMYPILCD